MIKINSANYISELGKRSNNEDNCAINPNKTYVVCDGVGGSEKGEIASDIVVREFINLFNSETEITANDAIKFVEAKLTSHIEQHPETMGMATTLTLAHIKSDSLYVAWCGDSRVYQFRNGNIIFKTVDHSWVNEAVKAGIITEEEAINHPKSNVITRAIQGSHKPVLIDDATLTDLQVNDTFLLCSDGILESWSDDDLIALFTSERNVDEILNKIKAECSVHSRDNFTAIVFKLDEVSIQLNSVINEPKTNFSNQEKISVEEVVKKQVTNDNFEENQNHSHQSINHKLKKKIPVSILYGIIVVLLLIISYNFFINDNVPNNKINKKTKISKQEKENINDNKSDQNPEENNQIKIDDSKIKKEASEKYENKDDSKNEKVKNGKLKNEDSKKEKTETSNPNKKNKPNEN